MADFNREIIISLLEEAAQMFCATVPALDEIAKERIELVAEKLGLIKKETENLFRGFHWSNRAWYAEANHMKNGNITFGIYSTEGGTVGEMTMEWIDFPDGLVPRLKVFEDSWKALASFKDLIDALGLVDGKCITEKEFVKILLGCGFKDLTAYEDKEKAALNG
jgi:hypothetical protein